MNLKFSVYLLTLILSLPSITMAQIGFQPNIQNGQLRFEDTFVGESSVVNVQVVNQGRQDATVSFNDVGDPFRIQPQQLALGAGDAGNFRFTFSPEEVDDYNIRASGRIIQGMGIQMFNTSLIGSGVQDGEPEISVDPERFDIQIEHEDDPMVLMLAIGNQGDAELECTISAQGDRVFQLEEDVEISLEPRDEVDLEISFGGALPEDGEYHGNLLIESNDPNTPELELPIVMTVNVNEPEVVEQRVQLLEGWNLISFNINPLGEYRFEPGRVGVDSVDVIRMMSQFADDPDDLRNTQHLMIMKNGRGRFYAPAHGFNGIEYVNLLEGYQVRLDQDMEGVWRGIPIQRDNPIELDAGWNMIAYLPVYDLPVTVVDRNDPDNPNNFYAIRSIIEHVLLLKGPDGQFAAPRVMFGNLTMHPGDGYQILVDEDCTLVYPEEPDQ